MSKKDDLKNIRDSIDSIDNQILSLVSERAKLAIQAGQAKQDSSKYKPARESSILNRLTEMNEGPLEQNQIRNIFNEIISTIKDEGLYKLERSISSPQSIDILTDNGRRVLNFCANNYLGLANHPDLINAAKKALDEFGFGMASVRFICGTQTIHKELEHTISDFFGTDDTILYTSCFDANGGLFETLLGPEDAVISDSLNHASIIDGI